MAGYITIGLMIFSFLLLFYHDAEWIPYPLRKIITKLTGFIWGLAFVVMVISAILTPAWNRFN